MSLSNTHYGAGSLEAMLKDCRSIFFIGIGGVSMCSLAEITLRDGLRVMGSDRTDGDRLARLRRMGAEVFIGHRAEQIEGADAVVYTVAIGEENPEYLAALQAGKPLISRADYLGYLMMRYPTRIGVAGMNGKSTTTAMCAHLLMQRGDPTVFCGAEAAELGDSSCYIGAAREQVVFEACEYKDSFLDFSPTVAVLLNICMDHVDYFHSMEQIRNSFLQYARKAENGGCVIANADDRELMTALQDYHGRLLTFGLHEGADLTARDIVSRRGRRSFTLCRGGEALCRVVLRQPADYQVENALAAAAVGLCCGLSAEEIAEGLGSFCGVKRRMEYRGQLNGADVYDDYSHHPDAVRGTLAGAKEMGYQRLLCAYQPHTYSRTAGLFEGFSRAFDVCDCVYFADIYAAREKNESGVSSAQLSEAVGERAVYCGSLASLCERLLQDAREGDLLVIMGAGDIENVFGMLPLT